MIRPGKAYVIPLIFAVMTFLPSVVSAGGNASYPLHDASAAGDIAEVKRLLDAGADVNAKDKYGETPLHWTSVSGRAEVVKVLLSSGAYVNPRDNNGHTPLFVTKERKKWGVVRLLKAAGGRDG